MEGRMFKQVDRFGVGAKDTFGRFGQDGAAIAQSGQLDPLVALERIGSRRSFARDAEIYAEANPSDCWYRVVTGAVRISKLLADGLRHIADFCFGGDCFGFDNAIERVFSAEAVGEVNVMRYPRRATERIIDENPN
jgi:CRP-like cAMP-binding protein